ncbi:MAG: OprO/OprP family phosphate-selective porin [Puniceicoccales bacterium]|nr:OprO/OprP family phosphate-selective porin [Puniceicoccales bacterium]
MKIPMTHRNTTTHRNHRNARRAFSAALAAAAMAPMLAKGAPDDPDTAALRARLDSLAEEVAALRQGGGAPAASSTGVTLDSDGLNFVRADKSASLKLGLLFQLDQRSWIEGASKDSFLLRRIRLPFSGTMAGGALKFAVIPEFQGGDSQNGGNTKLYDAWVEARHSPALGVRFGKFGCPVSLDSTDPRHFIEATYSNQIVPNRDIGVDVSGSVGGGVFSYRLGLYNGAPNNSYSDTLNIDDHFTLGARLSFAPWKHHDNALSGLFFGVGTAFGSERQTPAANAVRSGGQQTILPAFESRGGHFRVAPGVGYFNGPFSLLAEFAVDGYEHAGPAGRAVANNGWYVAVGWVLTGEKSTLGGVTPAAPFSLANRSLGAVEIAFRLSGLYVDRNLRDPEKSVSGALAFGVGLNWWLTKNAMFRIGVERTEFSGTRGTRTPALRDDELYVFSRFQLAF